MPFYISIGWTNKSAPLKLALPRTGSDGIELFTDTLAGLASVNRVNNYEIKFHEEVKILKGN